MIKSFKDKNVESIFNGECVKRMDRNLQDTIRRRLKYLNRAVSIDDLRIPPGNHFEKLAGRQEYSVRINDQWRLTFLWDGGPVNVALEDYH